MSIMPEPDQATGVEMPEAGIMPGGIDTSMFRPAEPNGKEEENRKSQGSSRLSTDWPTQVTASHQSHTQETTLARTALMSLRRTKIRFHCTREKDSNSTPYSSVSSQMNFTVKSQTFNNPLRVCENRVHNHQNNTSIPQFTLNIADAWDSHRERRHRSTLRSNDREG
jgi:hypothetical protein